MIVVEKSAYDGEVLESLLVKATTGNEIVEGGHIRIVPNVTKKFTLPRLTAGKMLQKRKEQPNSANSKGDFQYSERYLEPQDMMVYTEFNPKIFENVWREFQPKGSLVFSELTPSVQSTMLEEMAKVLNFELGGHYINGVKGDAEGEYFDGLLTRIRKEAEVLKVVGTAAITKENILNILAEVKGKIPTHVSKNPNLKIFMSHEDFEIYDAVQTAMSSKGPDVTQMSIPKYKGIQIVVLTSWPKDVIVAMVASMDLGSNAWGGVSLVDDADVVKIDKVTNSGELYFFKMLMKADTNIVFPEEIVLYDGVTAEASAEETEV